MWWWSTVEPHLTLWKPCSQRNMWSSMCLTGLDWMFDSAQSVQYYWIINSRKQKLKIHWGKQFFSLDGLENFSNDLYFLNLGIDSLKCIELLLLNVKCICLPMYMHAHICIWVCPNAYLRMCGGIGLVEGGGACMHAWESMWECVFSIFALIKENLIFTFYWMNKILDISLISWSLEF